MTTSMSPVRSVAVNFQSGFNSTRRLSAAAGVALLLILGVVPEGSVADRLALMALATLSLAVASGWMQFLLVPRLPQRVVSQLGTQHSRAWIVVTTAVVVMAGTAVQTWFRPGTTLAGGDDVVPNGTAWIARLFEPWIWSGSTLGEPSQLPMALPRAAILGLAHAFGVDPAIAHRIFESTLFIGAGLGVLGLLASLRMGPVAAFVGTTVYLFNPYVVTYVSPHDVYLAALFVFPAIPAALVGAGTGRLSVRWSAVLVAATAPLVGFSFFEPPLVGMILAAMLATPLVVAWVEGRDAALRSLRALLLAIPLLLITSAYWVVPAILHLSEANLSASGISLGFNWIGGELRTTIRNAFWLNTRWMWITPEYFPYANLYDLLPLSLLRFVLPALAFSALALAQIRRRDHVADRDRILRLAVVAATAALFLIFFSTGTKTPGNIIFDPLYSLPFGWLLQEPERFIMVVALVYGILIAIIVETFVDLHTLGEFVRSRRLTVPALRCLIVPLAVGMAFLVGFPLYTGALVPDTGSPLPIWANHARPQHIIVPTYWPEMAQFADALPIQGGVLVMPPDDFYEMPYTWYYGADSFIAEMFTRHVLVPSYPPSELVDSVNLTAESILHRDWRQTEALVTALNTPLILVRRDIVTPYPNHSILSPDDLATALDSAPNFTLLRQIGSLDLFALQGSLQETNVGADFTTINTPTPDLRILSVLPPRMALVSGESQAGMAYVDQAPGLGYWQAKGSTLIWQPPAPSGFVYRIAELDSKVVIPLDRAGTFTVAKSKARIVYAPLIDAVTVSIAGQTVISNGDFASGLWGPVTDCTAVDPTKAKPELAARLLPNTAPGGLTALQLSASLDNACLSQLLHWQGGPVVLTVMVNHIQGTAPQLCIWEAGPNRCASLPPIPDASGWLTYGASFSPDAGTTSLTLYLYADASQAGSRTVDEYADVRAIEVAALPHFALLADPVSQPRFSDLLIVTHNSFSTKWQGPSNGKHVLIDGMLNGWLIPYGSNDVSVHYEPTNMFLASQWISLVAYLVIVLLSLGSLVTQYPNLPGRTLWSRRRTRHDDNV